MLFFDLKRSFTKTRFRCNFSSDKCSDFIPTVSKTYPRRNVPLATAEQSRKCFESSVPGVNRSHIQYTFCNAPFHYLVQCEQSLRNALLLTRHSSRWLRSKQKLNMQVRSQLKASEYDSQHAGQTADALDNLPVF